MTDDVAGPLGPSGIGAAGPAGGHSSSHAIEPSAWPIWFAASSAVIFIGLAFTDPPLVIGGLVLVAAATIGWGADASREWRSKAQGGGTTPASSPAGARHGWGRAFVGTFIAVLGASILASLVVAAPPSLPPGGTVGGGPAASPGGSPAPSPSPGAGPTIHLVAHNIAFGTTSLTAPANTPFTIAFDNEDQAVPHNVQIKDASGASVFKGEIVTGPTTINYQVPALAPGTYTFLCDVHPTTMTGTITVQ